MATPCFLWKRLNYSRNSFWVQAETKGCEKADSEVKTVLSWLFRIVSWQSPTSNKSKKQCQENSMLSSDG